MNQFKELSDQMDMFSPNPFKDYDQESIDAFWKYHRENPKLYELFKKYARQMKATGRKYYGAQGIVERIRWDMYLSSAAIDSFKINNNYTPMFARLLVSEDPQFKNFFRMRKASGLSRPHFEKADLER